MDDVELLKLLALLVTVANVVIAGLNFLFTRFGEGKAQATRLGAIEADLKQVKEERVDLAEQRDIQIANMERELIRRLVALEANNSLIPSLVTKVDLFWGLVEEAMPKMLMHEDDIHRDRLLAKMQNRTITPDEATDLKALLEVDLAHDVDETSLKGLVTKFVIKRADLIARGYR